LVQYAHLAGEYDTDMKMQPEVRRLQDMAGG
jgi:hypothetical protein